MVAFVFMGNLFSVIRDLVNGDKLSNRGESVVVSKGNLDLVFEQKLKRGDGYLLGCIIHPISVVRNESYLSEVKKVQKVNINKFHKMLDHPSEAKTKATAKSLGIALSDKFSTCNNCAMGKAQQKNVPRERGSNQGWRKDFC